LGPGVVGLGRPVAVADLALHGLTGPLHAQVDHGLGLVLGRLEGIRPLDLAGQPVELLVALSPRHGPQVVPGPEPSHQRNPHPHGPVLPPPAPTRTTPPPALWTLPAPWGRTTSTT